VDSTVAVPAKTHLHIIITPAVYIPKEFFFFHNMF